MVKKTLLSLAIAATAAGLAGCNVSSTDKYENDIDNTPVTSGQPGSAVSRVAPVFSPGGGQVPLAIDLVYAINGATVPAGTPGKDGTADTADTTPPVTTALNKLDGFSTVAPIYIEFNADLKPDSVTAGETVFLVKLKNAEDDPSIDPLSIDTILATGNPFSASPIVPDTDYEARYITMDDGRTPAIQILLKKPLDPKTKYMVILTDGIESVSGLPVGPSAEFELVAGNGELPSSALNPVRTAVKGWQQLAAAALGASPNKSILSYTFTTGGGADVLKAMAAPALGLVDSVAKAEAAIIKAAIDTALGSLPEGATEAQINGAKAAAVTGANDTLDTVALAVIGNPVLSGTATALGVTDRTTLKASALAPYYHKALIENAIAPAKGIDLAALAAAIDTPASREFAALMDQDGALDVSYDTFLTVQITPKVQAAVDEAVEGQITSIAVGEGAIAQSVISAGGDQAAADLQLDAVANAVAVQVNTANEQTAGWTNLPTTGSDARTILKETEALQSFYLAGLRKAIADAQVPGQVAAQLAALSSKGTIYQGGLKVPNYLPEAEAGKADNELGNWVASDAAAQALNLPAAPRDKDGSTNVTYRFPFAKKLGDNVIPVFATLPADSCDPDGSGPAPAITKPADGWPVAIYQHGITVDRTAGVLVGNALAKACVAMVAIDHAMHGVGPTSATGLTFNVNTLAAGAIDANGPTANAEKSPFAVARAGAVGQGSTFFANLKERHNNVGKNTAQENVTMAFAAAGAAANVGASGDLYINLQDFARTRDGMRQTVLDLMNLAASIGDMDIDANPATQDLDSDNVYFIGHSLGGIIGTTFVAVNNDPLVQAYNPNLPEIKAAVLGNAGGGVVKLLENSPTFSVPILGGLQQAAGITQGSSNIEKFFGVLQATIDSADPINFAGAAHMQTLPILSYTAVGDSVVPNHALGEVKYDVAIVNGALTVTGATSGAVPTAKSYLSGTAPLDRQLGITKVVNSATAAGPVMGNRVSVRTAADKSNHGTFSSADPQATFAEIFGQIGSFLAEKAVVDNSVVANPLKLKGIKVSDTDVLEQVAE